jgi:uncharacterized protein YerC
MPHVSRYKLSNNQINLLSQRVIEAVLLIKNKRDLEMFFSDLLSSTEKIMLGKRLLIAIMIENAYSYAEIGHTLGVSDSTISSMSERLKIDGRGLRLAIKQLDRREKIKVMMDKFIEPINDLARQMPRIAYIRHTKRSL